jgi:hypothetical protein
MASVAVIQERIGLLVAERKALEARGGQDELEFNRIELARLRPELGREVAAFCVRGLHGAA